MATPKFTDARGVARDIGNDPRYGKITKAIRKAALAQSCVSDLAQALSCCTALDALLASPRKRGTTERATTEGALMMSAVMFYARATATNGGRGERGSIGITSKLAASQLADHQALLAIRNRVLAHVYSDEAVADDMWHQDRLFLVETEMGWLPASATKRVQFHKPTFARLHRQIPVAQNIVLETFHDHTNALVELFNSTPVPVALFESNLFDPVAFFGSERAVAKALQGMASGSAFGLSEGGMS